MATMIDGGELCVRTLVRAEITDIFVLHGGHLDPIFQACLDHNIRLIDTRHEAAAGHAADAYARQKGQPSVAMATAGPGYTNILTAITQCYLDCTPVLFIIGASPLRDVERLPLQGGIDQIAMAKPVTKWAAQATRTDLIPHLISHAIREATQGQPGPVLLEIPIDVLFDRVDVDKVTLPEQILPQAKPAPARASLDSAISALMAASRPAIICGGGMLYAKASKALIAFAEQSGIPVYSNNKGRGLIPTRHPLCGGALTNIKVAEASGIGTPDVVVMLGARFGMFTEPGMLGPGRIPSDACTIIQVDSSSVELGRIRPAHMPIVADCGEFLQAISELTRDTQWPDWQDWSNAVHSLSFWHQPAYENVVGKTRHLHPYQAVAEIVKAIDSDTIICADGGEASGWVELVCESENPGQLMSHGYLGCLGIGIPFAIGAQVANPEKRVIVITGDGSVGFNIQEFDTMVRHDLPIVTIVLNNKAWGMCVHGQQSMYGDNRLVVTTLADARYEQVAEGFGGYGEYVDSAENVGVAVKRALASGLPACINILTDIQAVLGDISGDKITRTAEADGEIAMPYYDNLKKTT